MLLITIQLISFSNINAKGDMNFELIDENSIIENQIAPINSDLGEKDKFDEVLASKNYFEEELAYTLRPQSDPISQNETNPIEPLGFLEYDNLLTILKQQNFLNFNNKNIDLRKLSNDPFKYVEERALVGLGLARGIERRIFGNESDNNLESHMGILESILLDINKFRTPSGIYIVNSSEISVDHGLFPPINEHVALGRENVFALILIAELMNIYGGFRRVDSQGGSDLELDRLFNSTRELELLNLANDTYIAMDTFQRVTYGLYAESIRVDIAGNPIMGSKSREMYTATNALMHQFIFSFHRIVILLGFPSSQANSLYLNIAETILDSLTKETMIQSVPGFELKTEDYNSTSSQRIGNLGIGLLPEWRNSTGPIKNSNSTTLQSNIWWVDAHLNWVVRHITISQNSGTQTIVEKNRDTAKNYLAEATDIMYNILLVFSENNGLPISSISLLDTNRTDISYSVEIIFLLSSLRRLSGLWDSIDLRYPELQLDDKSTTWILKAKSLRSNYNDLMFDKQSGSYFPTYDHTIGTKDRDDRESGNNYFVTNSLMFETSFTNFPFYLTFDGYDNVSINELNVLKFDFNVITFCGSFLLIENFIGGEVEFIGYVDGIETKRVVRNIDAGQGQGNVWVPYSFDSRGIHTVQIQGFKQEELFLDYTQEIRVYGEVSSDAPSSFELYSNEVDFLQEFTFITEQSQPYQNGNASYRIFEEGGKVLNEWTFFDLTDLDGKAQLDLDLTNVFEEISSDFNDNNREIPLILSLEVFSIEDNLLNPYSKNITLLVAEAELIGIVSPSILEATKGIGEFYSFAIQILDQSDHVVQFANVSVSFPNGTVEALSDESGVVEITIPQSNIITFESDTITKLSLSIDAENYPTSSIDKDLFINGNGIKITATPVQTEIRAKTFVESDLDPVLFRIDNEDFYGNQISATVDFSWINEKGNEIMGGLPNLPDTQPIRSESFTIDPSSLDQGIYNILIHAVNDEKGLGESKISINIVVRASTVVETTQIVLGLIAFTILGLLLRFTATTLKKIFKRIRSCPYCGEITSTKFDNCKNCGNLISK